MSDQDDFISPEEIQAKANSIKIQKFISSMGWQCIIFMIVVYATIFDNSLAITGLEVYAWPVGLSLIAFFLVVITPINKLSTSKLIVMNKSNSMLLNTPTAIVDKAICTLFSIVEMSIMLSYGFIYIAALWGAAEIFHYIAAYKLNLATKHVEFMEAVDRHCQQNPEFEKKLTANIEEIKLEITRLDKLADLVKNDNALDAELQKETLLVLAETHDELINLMEDLIIKAALETMNDQDIEK